MTDDDSAPVDDRVRVDHVATTITVAGLREALAGLPDDAIAFVAVLQRPDEGSYALQPLSGLDDMAVRPAPRGMQDAEGRTIAVLRADLPTGAYLVSPRG